MPQIVYNMIHYVHVTYVHVYIMCTLCTGGTVLGKGYTLRKMGDTEADIYSVISEATRYVCVCYGFDGNLSEARYKLWVSKTGKRTVTRVPELKALPPTSDAFEENVKRSHIQVFGNTI